MLFTVGAWGDGDGRAAAAFVVVVYGWVIVVAVLGAAGCVASGWVFVVGVLGCYVLKILRAVCNK